MLLGEQTVQLGVSFSGGSWDEPYDSVKCGTTTWTLPFVPRVPESMSGFWKKTQRWSMYIRASRLSSAFVTPSNLAKNSSSYVSAAESDLNQESWQDHILSVAAPTASWYVEI